MKKIIKMFSAVILLTLLTQNVFAQSCINPCSALAGPDVYYCPNFCSVPKTLGASPHSSNPVSTPGGCTATYSWAPSTGLSCTTCEHPSASPVATTTYTLTVTFSGNCGCDASNCMQCTRTDDVIVHTTTCSHCKINNLLFDTKVDDICLIVLPPFVLQPLALNSIPEVNNLTEENIQVLEANETKR